MNPIRLLLVDDETDFRQAVARRLSRRGFEPLQAGNGAECLSILSQIAVDVVVLDVKMPEIDGIEVLRRIKVQHVKIEVILLTGQASASDGVDGIKSGAFDYLSKPVELDHLITKIEQAYAKIQREKEKQREAEFRALIEQRMVAAERLASLGTLAAGVAHEINNPLAIIRESAGWMNQLLNRKELAGLACRQDFQNALEKISTAVERAKKITHQLLGVVREPAARLSPIRLEELVGETLQLLRQELKDKNIQVIADTDALKEPVWSDPQQLRQVLINLLTNAIHASEKNGKIYLILQLQDRHVVLEVKDTGIGIPPENIDRIFEPFFTTKSPGKGTGLGLFVSRSMVEKLGGKIEVESRLGAGSRFRIRLPRYPDRGKSPGAGIAAGALKKTQGEG